MQITEVRIKLMEDSDDRLQGFCSITFDDSFVVRDLKIIEGSSGPFVAMPSRKLTSHCPQCGCKNHLKAGYCNQCGSRLKDDRTVRDQEGRAKLYADIAHPINSACREMIQSRVIADFRVEQDRAKQPGYVSKYDDDYDDDIDAADIVQPEVRQQPILPPHTQIQPAENEIRAPHMLPQPSPPQGPQTPHSGLAKEQRENTNKPKKPGFGDGIFEE
ncbi:SpoVG family protein [Anatilimnocola floriformis]|uniref:SpoVG family protein n=1 Tax=Anatilimnocola floriformis TaxID=2948575 RepID=UPI0020C35115|nr:SpoVG family protein [Anatilimnocola floriformis]